MYAGHVACCPLMSNVKHAPHALLRSEKRRDRQTDGRQTVTLPLPPDAVSVINNKYKKLKFSFKIYRENGV